MQLSCTAQWLHYFAAVPNSEKESTAPDCVDRVAETMTEFSVSGSGLRSLRTGSGLECPVVAAELSGSCWCVVRNLQDSMESDHEQMIMQHTTLEASPLRPRNNRHRFTFIHTYTLYLCT